MGRTGVGERRVGVDALQIFRYVSEVHNADLSSTCACC